MLGVLEMLTLSEQNQIPTIIDEDVPRLLAIGDACLGQMHHLYQCLEKSTVIKPTLEAAIELLNLKHGSVRII